MSVAYPPSADRAIAEGFVNFWLGRKHRPAINDLRALIAGVRDYHRAGAVAQRRARGPHRETSVSKRTRSTKRK